MGSPIFHMLSLLNIPEYLIFSFCFHFLSIIISIYFSILPLQSFQLPCKLSLICVSNNFRLKKTTATKKNTQEKQLKSTVCRLRRKINSWLVVLILDQEIKCVSRDCLIKQKKHRISGHSIISGILNFMLHFFFQVP